MNNAFDAVLNEVVTYVKQSGVVSGVSDDALYMGIVGGLIAFLVMMLFSVVLLLLSCRGRGRTLILLTGPVGTGKTSLFYKLRDGEFRKTVTSFKANRETFTPTSSSKDFTFVDIPGSFTERYTDYIAQARAIIMVVSGDSIQRAGEHLYDLLSNPTVTSRSLPVLICLSKSDATPVLRTTELETKLLAVVDSKRTLQHSMESIDPSNKTKVKLGVPGQSFNLSQHPSPINVVTISSQADKIDSVLQFLEKL